MKKGGNTLTIDSASDRIFFLKTEMIEQKILQDFRWLILLGLVGLNWFSSDGTRYVRPFVIFRDCIQKVVQFTEPAVINYGLCGKFRAWRALSTGKNYIFLSAQGLLSLHECRTTNHQHFLGIGSAVQISRDRSNMQQSKYTMYGFSSKSFKFSGK